MRATFCPSMYQRTFCCHCFVFHFADSSAFCFCSFLRFPQLFCRFCTSAHTDTSCRSRRCACCASCHCMASFFRFCTVFLFCIHGNFCSGTHEVRQQKVDICITFIGFFHGCLFDDAFQGRCTVWIILTDIRQFLIDMFQCNGNRIVALKRQYAGNHFKHSDTQRIDIALFIHIAASCLFWRKIMYRTCCIGCGCHGCGTGSTGNAEVCYLYYAVCSHQNVLGFDVPMYDMCFVCLRKGRCDLDGYINGGTGIERCFLSNGCFQRIPMNVFHNDIVDISIFAYIIHTDNVRVRKSCGRTCFRTETFNKFFIANKFFPQNFDGHITIQFLVFAAVNHRHAP